MFHFKVSALFILLLYTIFTTAQKSCLPNEPGLIEDILCETNFNDRVQKQLNRLKTVNSYLRYKLENYEAQLRNCTDLANNTSMPRKCQQQTVYKSCNAAIKKGSGVYLLKPTNLNLEPFMAYCGVDPYGGPPWLYIHRRMTQSISFNRNMYEYERGFGNLYGTFWLGLNKIHAFTMARRCELWIYLKDSKGVINEGRYNFFVVGSKEMSYNLHALGNFSGTQMDALRVHQGYMFSTKDKNPENIKCDQRSCGGWWFNNKCGDSFLNNIYSEEGLPKSSWLGSTNDLIYTHMAIRSHGP